MQRRMPALILCFPDHPESAMTFSLPSTLNAKHWRLLIVFFLAGGPLGALLLLATDLPRVFDHERWYEIVLSFMIFGWLFGALPAMLTATLAVVCDWRRNANGVVALVLAGIAFSLFAGLIMVGMSELMGSYLLAGGGASLLLAPLLPAPHCPPVQQGLASAKGRRWLMLAMLVALPLLMVLAALLYSMALHVGDSARPLPRLFQQSLFLAALYGTPVMFVLTLAVIAVKKPRDNAGDREFENP